MEYADYREVYKERGLAAFKELADSAKQSFPGSFDSYLDLFNLYYAGDLCSTYYAKLQTDLSKISLFLI